MSNERKEKILAAIFLLIVITAISKIAQYFGYDSEPDRTRGFEYRQEKVKQLHSDQQTDRIIHELLK